MKPIGNTTTKQSVEKLWSPKYWGSWCFVGLCALLARIPPRYYPGISGWLAGKIKPLVKSRVRVCQTNISLCFPELDKKQQAELVEASLKSYIQGFFESIYCWWGDIDRYIDDLEVQGAEYYAEARSSGRGVLLIGAHFTILDFAIPTIASQMVNGGYMYRPNNNPVIDWMIERGRRRHFGLQAFSKRKTREMAQFLTTGGEVWYAPDQDFGPKYSKLFVTFFDQSMACISTPSRIVRETGCRVLQVSQFRRPDGGYKVCFRPLPSDFGENDQADAEAWNSGLETEIRKHSEQYLWVHKRFKTQPDGQASPY